MMLIRACILFSLLLSACGQTGSLYLPEGYGECTVSETPSVVESEKC
jgi:predicted small lipoprotein YifL